MHMCQRKVSLLAMAVRSGVNSGDRAASFDEFVGVGDDPVSGPNAIVCATIADEQ
jgi:hypothetical protein